jgi:hypothetical protein
MAEITFTIPREIFAGLEKVRLRGVGLSVSYFFRFEDPSTPQNRVFRMELTPPPMVAEDGALYFRPPLVFRNVRWNTPELGASFASASAVHNLDPASSHGWKLRINRTVLQLISSSCEIRQVGLPSDINLHLTVSAVTDQPRFFTHAEADQIARSEQALHLAEEALAEAEKLTGQDNNGGDNDHGSGSGSMVEARVENGDGKASAEKPRQRRPRAEAAMPIAAQGGD